jgi:hypothetical protein
MQNPNMSALTEEPYFQWKILLEQQLVQKFRHSVRNEGIQDPVFQIDDIPRRTSENGFGIAGVTGNDLVATVQEYSGETGNIDLDVGTGQFRLTDRGKQYMRELDPQIE